jgi:hypothetical protein
MEIEEKSEEIEKSKFITILVNIEGKNKKNEYRFTNIEETDYQDLNERVNGVIKQLHIPIPAPKNKKEKGEKTNE